MVLIMDRSKVAVKDGLKKGDYKQYLMDVDRKAREMKIQSNQMEKENILMERKIAVLKEKLRREKEEREQMGGPRWQSSQVNKNEPKPKGPRRIRVLSDEPLEHYNKNNCVGKNFQLCGQCEHKRAKVLCNECCENYCSSCYKQFHSKGALRKHTWISLQKNVSEAATMAKNSASSSSPRSSSSDQLQSKVISVAGFSVNKSPTDKTKPRQRSNNRSSGEPTNNNEMLYSKTKEGSEIGNYTRKSDMYDNNGWNGSAINSPFNQSETSMTISLLDGTYDENESAASFQEALREWRTAGSTSKQDTVSLPDVKKHSTSVGGDQPISRPSSNKLNINIKLNSSLSYMDKLMLKQHRKNPKAFTEKPLYSSASSIKNQNSDDNSNHTSPVEPPKTPSSCILTVDCSSPGPLSSSQPSVTIDIFPMGEVEGEEGETAEECNLLPIITPAKSDEEKAATRTHSRNNPVAIVELDFTQENKDLTLQEASSKVESDNQKKVVEDIVIPQQRRHPYKDMSEYFTLGVSTDEAANNPKESTLTCFDRNVDQNISMVSQDENLMWYPTESYCQHSSGTFHRQNHSNRNEENDHENDHDHEQTLPHNFDYLQVLPPSSKVNFNQLHRASSTSLSISALPVDVWVESDVSSPNSRQPSLHDISDLHRHRKTFERDEKSMK